jgi:hypothetical protein
LYTIEELYTDEKSYFYKLPYELVTQILEYII